MSGQSPNIRDLWIKPGLKPTTTSALLYYRSPQFLF